MNSKYRELTWNTVVFAIGTFGSKFVLFFMVPLYTNVLSSEEYGTADLVQTVATLFVPIISIMIQDSVLRFGLSKHIDKLVVLKNAIFVSLIGCFIGLLCIPVMKLYRPIEDWVYYLYWIMVTNISSNVFFAYIKSIDKNKLYSICGILSSIVLASSNIICLLQLKMGVQGYLISIILSQGFSTVFLFFFGGIYKNICKTILDYNLMKDMIVYSVPLIANNMSWWILNSSGKILIGNITSISDLGLYTAASKIPALISVVNTIFLQAWTISSIKDYENEKDTSFFSMIFKYYSIAMFGFVAFIMLILKKFMSLYVGVEYQEAWQLVPLLLYGTVFYGFSLFFGTIYSAAKKNINIAVSTAFAAAINIVVNLILLKHVGVIAASISTAISYFAVGLYRIIDSRRFLKINICVDKFIINSILVAAQTILVTLDWKSLEVSLATIILFIAVNWKSIISIPVFLKNSIKE